jgi:hypothetical protein
LKFGIHAPGATKTNGTEVRKVEATDNGAKLGVAGDLREELREDERVRDSNMSIQDGQSSRKHGA